MRTKSAPSEARGAESSEVLVRRPCVYYGHPESPEGASDPLARRSKQSTHSACFPIAKPASQLVAKASVTPVLAFAHCTVRSVYSAAAIFFPASRASTSADVDQASFSSSGRVEIGKGDFLFCIFLLFPFG